MSNRRSPSYSVPTGSPPSAVLISLVDVLDAHVVAGAQGPVGLDQELRLRALLFDVHVDRAGDRLEHGLRLPGIVEQFVRIGARELDRQVGRRAVGVFGHAVDDRLREIEPRGGKLLAKAVAEGLHQLLLVAQTATGRAVWGRSSSPSGWAETGRCRCRCGRPGPMANATSGNSRPSPAAVCRRRASACSDVPSGKLARTQITPSSM